MSINIEESKNLAIKANDYYNNKDIKDLLINKFYVKAWYELIEGAKTYIRWGEAMTLDWEKPFPKKIIKVAEILKEMKFNEWEQ